MKAFLFLEADRLFFFFFYNIKLVFVIMNINTVVCIRFWECSSGFSPLIFFFPSFFFFLAFFLYLNPFFGVKYKRLLT